MRGPLLDAPLQVGIDVREYFLGIPPIGEVLHRTDDPDGTADTVNLGELGACHGPHPPNLLVRSYDARLVAQHAGTGRVAEHR